MAMGAFKLAGNAPSETPARVGSPTTRSTFPSRETLRMEWLMVSAIRKLPCASITKFRGQKPVRSVGVALIGDPGDLRFAKTTELVPGSGSMRTMFVTLSNVPLIREVANP